jgi:phosphoglycerate dehydrogenase-like enzyme
MKSVQISLAITLAWLCYAPAHAQSEIDKLVEQTGIEPGAAAMRDLPRWRAPKKIVVRDVDGTAAAVEGLLAGVELVAVRSEAEAIAQGADADAIIGYCSDNVVAAAPHATWVQVFAAGAERCMQTARILERQVVLTNMQKMASPVIADHVIAMTLALARRLPQFVQVMQSGEWSRGYAFGDDMQSIGGKTMLVLGLGGIGTEVARRAAALEMRVIGTRRSSREGPAFVDYVGLSSEMHALAAQADFIVNALPLTPETTAILDADFFAAAKPGAHFINVGRGKSVVTADLVSALKAGRLAGAGLDVTNPEPLPPDHPLWQLDNVIITPHVASGGGNRDRQIILLRENLRRFAAGDALLNVVDPALGY